MPDNPIDPLVLFLRQRMQRLGQPRINPITGMPNASQPPLPAMPRGTGGSFMRDAADDIKNNSTIGRLVNDHSVKNNNPNVGSPMPSSGVLRNNAATLPAHSFSGPSVTGQPLRYPNIRPAHEEPSIERFLRNTGVDRDLNRRVLTPNNDRTPPTDAYTQAVLRQLSNTTERPNLNVIQGGRPPSDTKGPSSITVQRSQEQPNMYQIRSPNGQRIGEAEVTIQGNRAFIEHIGRIDPVTGQSVGQSGSNTLGPATMREFFRQLKKLHPELTTAQGHRIGGARGQSGHSGDIATFPLR